MGFWLRHMWVSSTKNIENVVSTAKTAKTNGALHKPEQMVQNSIKNGDLMGRMSKPRNMWLEDKADPNGWATISGMNHQQGPTRAYQQTYRLGGFTLGG